MSGVTLDSLNGRIGALLASRQLFDCWLWAWTQRPPSSTSAASPHSAASHRPSAATQQSAGTQLSDSSATQDSLAGLSDDEASYGSGESSTSGGRLCRRYCIAHTVLRVHGGTD